VKLYLDMATSLLVFAGAYAPTYRQRADALRALAGGADRASDWPFPLDEFADRVACATRVKLGGGAGPTPGADLDGQLALLDWGEAVADARRLWRWELTRLGGAEPQLDDRSLLGRWMSAQPLPARLRGWLYVARRTGWWRSLAYCPRWIRYAWRASPRYWVYASATELLFGLPALLGPAPAGPSLSRLRELTAALPVSISREAGPTAAPWQRLAADITWNYKQFLTDTRA
jgi:hypothetical protein